VSALVAFLCGVLFAVGLGVSGMLQPARIIGFLDFFGTWDPTLLGVMAGAIPVYFVAWRLGCGRRSACGSEIPARPQHGLDARLVVGASLFGVGWALAGVCPGPALTNIAAPSTFTVAVLASVVAGVAASWCVPSREQ